MRPWHHTGSAMLVSIGVDVRGHAHACQTHILVTSASFISGLCRYSSASGHLSFQQPASAAVVPGRATLGPWQAGKRGEIVTIALVPAGAVTHACVRGALWQSFEQFVTTTLYGLFARLARRQP